MSKSEEATLNEASPLEEYHITEEGLVSSDPADPRVTEKTRATVHELDSPYARQLSDYIHPKERDSTSKDIEAGSDKDEGPIYVRFFPLAGVCFSQDFQIDFEKDDPRNPLNFTTKRKWAIAMCAIFFTGLSGKL